MQRQFIIQLDNRPGELAHLARALGERGINITNISCVGSGCVASAFITTDQGDEARQVLRGLGHPFVEGHTLLLDVEDHPGGLADVTERLAAAGVNILGTLVVARHPGTVEMAFTVDDLEKARATVGQKELAGVR